MGRNEPLYGSDTLGSIFLKTEMLRSYQARLAQLGTERLVMRQPQDGRMASATGRAALKLTMN